MRRFEKTENYEEKKIDLKVEASSGKRSTREADVKKNGTVAKGRRIQLLEPISVHNISHV